MQMLIKMNNLSEYSKQVKEESGDTTFPKVSTRAIKELGFITKITGSLNTQ
jgi:hypothetical protein